MPGFGGIVPSGPAPQCLKPLLLNDQPDCRLSLGSRMSARATGKTAPRKGHSQSTDSFLASFAQRSSTSSNNRHFKQFLSESGEMKLILRHDLAEERKVLAENVHRMSWQMVHSSSSEPFMSYPIRTTLYVTRA